MAVALKMCKWILLPLLWQWQWLLHKSLLDMIFFSHQWQWQRIGTHVSP